METSNSSSLTRLLLHRDYTIFNNGANLVKYKNDVLSQPIMMKKLRLKHCLKGHEGCVNTVSWNSQGNLLISGSDDTELRIWRDPTYTDVQPAKRFQESPVPSIIRTGHTGNVFCAIFLPLSDDTKVVSCAADGDVRLFDISNHSRVTTLATHRAHGGMANKVVGDVDNPHLFMSCGQDGTVRLYDSRESAKPSIITDLRPMFTKGRDYEINSMAVNPRDSNFYIIGGGDSYVRMFDRRKPLKCLLQTAPREVHEKAQKNKQTGRTSNFTFPVNITSVKYHYTGKSCLTSYSGENVYHFDLDTAASQDTQSTSTGASPGKIHETILSEYTKFSGHVNIRTVKEVTFMGPRDDFVVSGSDCGHIFVWHTKTGALLNILKGDKHVVNSLAASPTYEPFLASSGIEYDIKIWRPISTLAEETTPFRSVMFKAPEILRANEEQCKAGHNNLMIPASVVLNLMNLLTDDSDSENEDDEGNSTETPSESEEEQEEDDD